MIPVKVQCGCGQRYAFEVEPVDGRMSSPVACPACGVDGTAAANEIISQSRAAQPAIIPPPVPRGNLRITSSGHSENSSARPASVASTTAQRITQLGIVDRKQAEHEARAKISWGDPPNSVIQYLMMQGFDAQEASGLVQVMFKERIAATRKNGMRKIVVGFSLVCVPIGAYITFARIGVIPLKLMGVAIAIGLWGAWMILSGILLIVAPKMETGDVAEQ